MNLRVGIIGVGPKTPPAQRGKGRSIARAHGRSWNQTAGAELVAACDINDQNLSDYVEEFSLTQSYLDYRDMLKQTRLDIVDICTWPGLHSDMIVAAAEAGVRGIYCEKPLCLSLEEASIIAEACRKHNVCFSIGHQRRLAPHVVQAKQWIEDGRMGRIVEMTGRVPADLMSWGTHWFDLYSYFMNDVPPISVFAQADCSNQSVRYGHLVEDVSLVAVKYPNDVNAYLHADFSQPLHKSDLRIVGEQGMIEITHKVRGLFSDQSGWVESPLTENPAIQKAFEDMVDAMSTGRESKLNLRLAYSVTETIMAAYESAVTRKEVVLPLRNMAFPLLSLRLPLRAEGT